MFKKIAGLTVLMALLVAPMMLMTRSAVADVCSRPICYTGKIGRPLGIVLHGLDPEVADLLVRARVASEDWDELGRFVFGYEVCRPLTRER